MMTSCAWVTALISVWMLTACNDAAPAGLVRVVDESAGGNCANGGVAIQTGADENQNGLLDPSEVEETSYVCADTEEPGEPPQLVRVDQEAPGANCPDGGVAVHVGADANDNGVLDDVEITGTSYVCGSVAANPAVIYGNLHISNHLEVSKLIGVEEVTGSVVIDAPGLMSIDLADLKRVGVDLHVTNTALVSLSLPALQEVGRDFVVSTNTELTSVAAPGLTLIGRDLQLSDTVATSDFTMLTSVRVLLSGATGNVTFPALTSALSIRVFGGYSASTSISFPVLTQVGKPNDFGGLELRGQALQSAQFPLLGVVYGNVDITSTPLQAITGFPVLTRISNQLVISSNPSLTNLSFPMLTMLVNLLVATNPQLPACQVTALATQTGATQVTNSGNNAAGTCP